ncbi:MAG: DUF692 domain-containing protein [Gammaproteobacteria bacterium]|nr:DUF692 domain-containing protein [Gammaproteobacteria bacterium]
MSKEYCVSGAGLGLRRGHMMEQLLEMNPTQVKFMEVAPENWIGMGGRLGKRFREYTERYDFVAHGLSLSIGGPTALDLELVKDIKKFMQQHNILKYTEHLTYCSDQGHLYDLMPIPFTNEAVHYVADRIKQVQDILGQRIAMENASYYAAPGKEMEEIEFLKAVLDEADCELLLDVNNIYVNSVNHNYNPITFLQSLPKERITYCHIAGHFNEDEDLIVDTHGADVIESVWTILDTAYETFGVFPTLLERDFNIPELPVLMKEVDQICQLQKKWGSTENAVTAHA